MRLLVVLAALLAGAPLLTYLLFLLANARAGQLAAVRALCGGRLAWPLARGVVNAAWSLALVAMSYPLGWMPRAEPRAALPGGPPAVLLVHGLYHNASAWLLFRHRLGRAGFGDVRACTYLSFFRPFADIVEEVAGAASRAAEASPTGMVLLVGHSLGGLACRAAMARPELSGRVAGLLTLGTPHQGSLLAGFLAVGRLGRGLSPDGEVIRQVRALPVPGVPALSLYTPTDSMVLPLSGALLGDELKAAGWREACLPPQSHVGLLYSKSAVEAGLAFLAGAARSPTSPEAWPAGPRA